MSYVTNLILHMSILEEENEQETDTKIIEQVNKFFDEQGIRPLIGLHNTELLPGGWYGGQKYLECHVYVGAFNYLDLDGFLRHLQTVPFEEPEEVQVWIKDQHETSFRLVYGVEETDPRIRERDILLRGAEDWLSEMLEEKKVPSWEIGLLKEWLERCNRLYRSEEK